MLFQFLVSHEHCLQLFLKSCDLCSQIRLHRKSAGTLDGVQSSPSCLVSTISVLSLSSSLVKSAGATAGCGRSLGGGRALFAGRSGKLGNTLGTTPGAKIWRCDEDSMQSAPSFCFCYLRANVLAHIWLPIIFFAKVKGANLRRSPYNLKVGSTSRRIAWIQDFRKDFSVGNSWKARLFWKVPSLLAACTQEHSRKKAF